MMIKLMKVIRLKTYQDRRAKYLSDKTGLSVTDVTSLLLDKALGVDNLNIQKLDIVLKSDNYKKRKFE